MKILNIIKSIIKFPFTLITFPLVLFIAFCNTDFEDSWDRKYFKRTLINWFK